MVRSADADDAGSLTLPPADPIIRSTVTKIPGAVLVECPVGDRAVYKNNPTHPYRVHAKAKLTAVPTLYRWAKVRRHP